MQVYGRATEISRARTRREGRATSTRAWHFHLTTRCPYGFNIQGLRGLILATENAIISRSITAYTKVGDLEQEVSLT